jgi:methionyl-tRNA formyltransferase
MMRILYAGSPEPAVEPLRAILEAGFEVSLVLSQPDRPVGRKRILTPTPVSTAAQQWGLPISHPRSREELIEVTRSAQPDLAIAVAYGRMIPPEALTTPQHGWWNLHFSLLPRWRGATPVQHALLHGDTLTGVSVFQMDEGLDTGDILATSDRKIRALDTTQSLLDALATDGGALLVSLLRSLRDGVLTSTPQSGDVTYAPKLTRDDARLDWALPAAEIYNRFRAVTPEPGAHTMIANTDRSLVITQLRPHSEPSTLAPGEVFNSGNRILVGCADSAVELVRVKPAGKSEMAALDWWRGAGAGVRLG